MDCLYIKVLFTTAQEDMITKRLKTVEFNWDGKYMEINYPELLGRLKINRVHLLSLMRFGLRCLTRHGKNTLKK